MGPLLEGLLRSLGGSEANFLELCFGRFPYGNFHTKATSKKFRPPSGNFRPNPPRTSEKSLHELFQSGGWPENCLTQAKTEVAPQFLDSCAAEVALQQCLFCSADGILTKSCAAASEKLQCNIEKAALQESGAFLPLSCGFQAPTFRHPRLGPADETLLTSLSWVKLCIHLLCISMNIWTALGRNLGMGTRKRGGVSEEGVCDSVPVPHAFPYETPFLAHQVAKEQSAQNWQNCLFFVPWCPKMAFDKGKRAVQVRCRKAPLGPFW